MSRGYYLGKQIDKDLIPRTLLTITIGLPGSGKTTKAREFCRTTRAIRVNRDDMRQMLFGADVLNSEQESIVSIAQQAAVRALLRAGFGVIVDDTNLHPKSVPQWQELANDCGVSLAIMDLRDVPIAVCKARNAERALRGGRLVPDHVIDQMAERIK